MLDLGAGDDVVPDTRSLDVVEIGPQVRFDDTVDSATGTSFILSVVQSHRAYFLGRQ